MPIDLILDPTPVYVDVVSVQRVYVDYVEGLSSVNFSDIGGNPSDNAALVAYTAARGTINFGMVAGFNPADSTTYSIGNWATAPVSGASPISILGREMTIPVTGRIKAVAFTVWVASTAGTSENSTFSLVVFNNGAQVSETILSSAVKWDGVNRWHLITGLNISVSQGNTFVIRFVTPAWATNPMNTWINGALYIM